MLQEGRKSGGEEDGSLVLEMMGRSREWKEGRNERLEGEDKGT